METIVISVGGSLIVPKEINVDFIKNFKKIIVKQVNKGKRFMLITGGGNTCRKYNKAGRLFINEEEYIDWIGIRATQINAQLMIAVFKEFYSGKEFLLDYNKKIKSNDKVLIGCGWKPGCTSDYDAVKWAENINAEVLINLSDVDYVYDKDPRKYKDARPIKEISWKDFIKTIGDKFVSGMNVPFDPVASKEAEKIGLKVVIMNGNDLDNFEDFLGGKGFKGSIIS